VELFPKAIVDICFQMVPKNEGQKLSVFIGFGLGDTDGLIPDDLHRVSGFESFAHLSGYVVGCVQVHYGSVLSFELSQQSGHQTW